MTLSNTGEIMYLAFAALICLAVVKLSLNVKKLYDDALLDSNRYRLSGDRLDVVNTCEDG
ncbi:hypothetical protein [Sphingomonas sp. 8AM]|uniref:hypothetical protein n=1 Tax=Sphingomonas sp. 8AM TaxID=2653170 RepID=UPI0012F35D83|nr:hypothetical protein [Sphingomonas sp. 8AM]VXD00613.1 hypothetical protein SPHINGO8AM_70217 [Sphingomonas sp. 8AM]